MKKPEGVALGGLTIDNGVSTPEVFVTPKRFAFQAFRSYFHEAGHVLGARYSFRDGHFLIPSEVAKAKISLSVQEKARFLVWSVAGALSKDENIEVSSEIREIADRVLQLYSKGIWNPNSIRFQNASSEYLLNRIIQGSRGRTTAMEVTDAHEIKVISSKEGRNDEISSLAAETACMTILGNSLGIVISPPERSEEYWQSSHGRARRIVERGFARNWKLPSEIDLQDSEK